MYWNCKGGDTTESKLFSLVDGHLFAQWLLILALVGYFAYKEWPNFWSRVKHRAQIEESPDKIAERLDRIEASLKEVEAKLGRDYTRINAIELRMEKDRHVMKDIKSEQGIIMRALLGALSGLQELGANGSTEVAREEIISYLNKQAHEGDE